MVDHRAWEKQVGVDPAMTFREKQEELALLGAAYKWLFQEGFVAKIPNIDVKQTHDLVLERARRITVSMTPSEREIAGLLSPQPRPTFHVPGTKPFRPREGA